MDLSKMQIQAVAHLAGPMLVLAGPGSGKTKVITERTKYLIEQYKIKPQDILVITFTKAAAQEMKYRFNSITEPHNYPVTIGTFHSVFFKILRAAYGFTVDAIISEEEKARVIREILYREKIDSDDESDFIQTIISAISIKKNQLEHTDPHEISGCSQEEFEIIYNAYKEYMNKNKKIDFDDMMIYCYELFQQRKDILAAWQNYYKYILIDEFQDVNPMQFAIVKLLAGKTQNLFAVGDDDQAIYGFRGSDPRIMIQFRDHFPKAQLIVLDKNYRCQENIMERALCLINYNKQRYKKEIYAARDALDPIVICEFKNIKDETNYILENIRKDLANGIHPGEIAVLYRTSIQARPLLEKLMEYNLPFSLKEGVPDIYQHWISQNILSYIKFASGENRRSLFLTIMNRPNRYISRDALKNGTVSFEELFSYYKEQDWMCDRIVRLQKDCVMLSELPPFAAVQYIRSAIGYDDFIKEYALKKHIIPEELLVILDELCEHASKMNSIKEWFEFIDTYQREWKEKLKMQHERQDAVCFLTMHGAKGLEFKKVYILEANEEITPHKKAVSIEEIEEERRLFYVAMTRAADELIICSVQERYGKPMKPSRFLKEIYFDHQAFKPGTYVLHKTYGKGIIEKIQENKADILFVNSQKRITVNISYCIEKGIIKMEI